ncbi:MAG: DNA adenine methylase [Candidatus Altiarchaeota archaeon]|nr:DNA adenine methylase [Candidatus Altiarchaeota archaeon]
MHYPGGKGQSYKRIINMMPPHEVYIETHLGGGAVLLNKKPAQHNIGIEIDLKTIAMWSEQEMDFELIHGDAVEFLKGYNFKGKELVYCDPPYLIDTRKKQYPLYDYEYSDRQHVELLNVIKTLPCMVMISGYESELYKESLNDWYTYCFRAGCQHGMAIEWLWMNYDTPIELHDYRYLGDTFRKREQLKKKKERWVKKLESMPVLERQALMLAIDSVREGPSI